MAHTKTGTTTKGNRDSAGKRLGVKVYGGDTVIAGNIIIRQRGTKVHAGAGTKLARDFTIYSLRDGIVHFINKYGDKYVEVMPQR